jgi:aryl-alcohol dehydrogenase-like predicted oxidoreductase
VTYAVVHETPSWGMEVRIDAELRDYASVHDDFALIAYSPLMRGAYAGRPLPPEFVGADSDARLAALAQVAAETGATANQVVLAWMLQSAPAVLPLFGASTLAQLQETLGALDAHLTDAQMTTLNEAGA